MAAGVSRGGQRRPRRAAAAIPVRGAEILRRGRDPAGRRRRRRGVLARCATATRVRLDGRRLRRRASALVDGHLQSADSVRRPSAQARVGLRRTARRARGRRGPAPGRDEAVLLDGDGFPRSTRRSAAAGRRGRRRGRRRTRRAARRCAAGWRDVGAGRRRRGRGAAVARGRAAASRPRRRRRRAGPDESLRQRAREVPRARRSRPRGLPCPTGGRLARDAARSVGSPEDTAFAARRTRRGGGARRHVRASTSRSRRARPVAAADRSVPLLARSRGGGRARRRCRGRGPRARRGRAVPRWPALATWCRWPPCSWRWRRRRARRRTAGRTRSATPCSRSRRRADRPLDRQVGGARPAAGGRRFDESVAHARRRRDACRRTLTGPGSSLVVAPGVPTATPTWSTGAQTLLRRPVPPSAAWSSSRRSCVDPRAVDRAASASPSSSHPRTPRPATGRPPAALDVGARGRAAGHGRSQVGQDRRPRRPPLLAGLDAGSAALTTPATGPRRRPRRARRSRRGVEPPSGRARCAAGRGASRRHAGAGVVSTGRAARRRPAPSACCAPRRPAPTPSTVDDGEHDRRAGRDGPRLGAAAARQAAWRLRHRGRRRRGTAPSRRSAGRPALTRTPLLGWYPVDRRDRSHPRPHARPREPSWPRRRRPSTSSSPGASPPRSARA